MTCSAALAILSCPILAAEPHAAVDEKFTEPGGFDRFVAEVGESAAARTLPPPLDGPPDIAAISSIAAQHGIEILGPPGPPPSV